MSAASERRARAEAWIGRTVAGRYRLARVIGVGGHGAVFDATHEWTKKRVALKLLLPEEGSGGGSEGPRADRFLREAKAATRVVHPNVVEVHDCGRDPTSGALYLAQEYLEGMDLRARLRAKPALGVAGALAVAIPVARALEAAHAQGVVHRDLKPGNVFLARTRQGGVAPKLIDFGISKLLDGEAPAEDEEPLTREGALLGTPEYMAPEQARGELEVGPAVDQWALGVLLYEVIAGRRPFAGTSPASVLLAVVQGPPAPLDARALGLPDALEALILRALEKHPSARFASMGEMAKALEEIGASDGAGATLDITEEARPATGLGPDTLRPGELPSAVTDVDAVAPVLVKGTRVAETAEAAKAAEAAEDPFAGAEAPPVGKRRAGSASRVAVVTAAVLLGVGGLAIGLDARRSHPAVTATTVGRANPRGLLDAGVGTVRSRPTQPVAADLTEARALLGPTAPQRVPEHLSTATLREVMPPMAGRFARCVGGDWPGAVGARLRVRGDGTVVEAAVTGRLANTAAGRCVEGALRGERFPRFTAREQRVDWTWPRVTQGG